MFIADENLSTAISRCFRWPVRVFFSFRMNLLVPFASTVSAQVLLFVRASLHLCMIIGLDVAAYASIIPGQRVLALLSALIVCETSAGPPLVCPLFRERG